ncbi:MAG TPA: LacI family DNA-binding transcriptional regulator [Burkholderiaceae bacterium]|nr:LacI family DNA-binding transcriptional regulator [Burkholderiaceae bacterium]
MDTKSPKARPATILDVAAEANVSKSTVSLVLQGSELIRDETAERVRRAARRLGYVYNRRAADLRRKSSNMIGVLINDLMNPFFAEVLVGLERRLVEAGYIVLMAHTSEDIDRQQRVLWTMREQHAAGIALCPTLGTPPSLTKTVQGWGIPLVVMVRTLGRGDYDFAGADNALGVQLATEHLLAQGHRRIGFLGGLSGPVLRQRLQGYEAALKRAGIGFDERLVFASPPTRQGGYDSLRKLLDEQPRVTAAACYNDLVAFGALSALGEAERRAGADFALIGFDNILDTAHSNPPLSTVDIRPTQLGEHAAELLLARIDQPRRARQRYLAQPTLVLRQSG